MIPEDMQPRSMLFHSLVTSFSLTLFSLSLKNDRIRWRDFVSKPYASSFFTTSEWHRESKALLISVDRTDTISFLSTAWPFFSLRSTSAKSSDSCDFFCRLSF